MTDAGPCPPDRTEGELGWLRLDVPRSKVAMEVDVSHPPELSGPNSREELSVRPLIREGASGAQSLKAVRSPRESPEAFGDGENSAAELDTWSSGAFTSRVRRVRSARLRSSAAISGAVDVFPPWPSGSAASR